VCVLLFVAHASIQRACVARFALPRVTSFSSGAHREGFLLFCFQELILEKSFANGFDLFERSFKF
jgi:hypothetical protein